MPFLHEQREDVRRCLVVVVRNPYSWAQSMADEPFSGQQGLAGLTTEEFIVHRWNATEDCSKFHQSMVEHQCLPEARQGGPIFDSLADFRAAKLRVYLDALSQEYTGGTHLLRYEDLLMRPEETLDEVAESCGTDTVVAPDSLDQALADAAWHGSRKQTTLFGMLQLPFDLEAARRSLLQEPQEMLGAAAYSALDRTVDWGVEAFVGYSPGTLLPSVPTQSIPWAIRRPRHRPADE
jgi:hypothetical protein